MFNLDDEEEDDFNIKPNTGSKLANLFDSNDIKLDIESSNKSLIYTPPKQPKKFEITTNSSADNQNNTTNTVMTLILASAVNVFKFENDSYRAQGKLGAALLGNHDTGNYKLILYTGKQQHITYATITDSFKLICQPNNYSSFYDDNRQNWSIMFDTEEEKCNFNRQLTVCKYNTILKSENQSLILTQDLIIGNENSAVVVEDNDNIELRYKGWLFDDNQCVGKLFVNIDSTSGKKAFKIKANGKWIQIFKDMRIGGKRFAIIGRNMKDQFPEIMENTPIGQSNIYGFEFQLLKIQTRNQTQNKIQQKPEIKAKNDSTKEQKISDNSSEKEMNSVKKSHSNSISDSVKEVEIQTSKPKSDILSRVTRMGGLPILPMKPMDTSVIKSEPLDTTDTNEDDNQTKPFPKPRNSSLTSSSSQSNETSIASTNYSNTRIPETNSFSAQIPVTSMSANSYTQPIPTYFMSQNIDSNSLSILTAEMHSNNTEIRMNLNKIIDKIDSVSEKVNDIKTSSTTSNINSMSISSIGFMDSAILLSSIQRIVNENNSLKKELEDKTSSLQKLNEKICDLLHQQNIQNSGNSSHQNTQELDRLLMSETRLKREIIVLNEDCNRFRTKNNELLEENQRLKQTVKDLQTVVESKPAKVSDRSESIQSTKEFKNQIKKLMNEVFRKFNAQMDENKLYKSDEICEIVSNSIRSATLLIIDSQTNSRTNSPFRHSVDEIDLNKDKSEVNSNDLNKTLVDSNDKAVTKPPIPQRKSIETQQQINKNIDSSESENTKVSEESIESTEESKQI